MQSTATIDIDCPIDHVFRVTTERVVEWSHIVVEDEQIDDGPPGVGTRFRCVTEDRGNRIDFEGVVTEHDPPRAHAIELTGKMFDLEAAYTFEPLSDTSTRLTQHSKAQGKGIWRAFFFCFGWMMKKSGCEATKRDLESLKALCESGA